MAFDLNRRIRQEMANPAVVHFYTQMMHGYATNGTALNHSICQFLWRLIHPDHLNLEPMLYQVRWPQEPPSHRSCCQQTLMCACIGSTPSMQQQVSQYTMCSSSRQTGSSRKLFVDLLVGRHPGIPPVLLTFWFSHFPQLSVLRVFHKILADPSLRRQPALKEFKELLSLSTTVVRNLLGRLGPKVPQEGGAATTPKPAAEGLGDTTADGSKQVGCRRSGLLGAFHASNVTPVKPWLLCAIVDRQHCCHWVSVRAWPSSHPFASPLSHPTWQVQQSRSHSLVKFITSLCCPLQLECSPQAGPAEGGDEVAGGPSAEQGQNEARMREASSSMLFIDMLFWKSAAVCDEIRNEYWLKVRLGGSDTGHRQWEEPAEKEINFLSVQRIDCKAYAG